MNKRYNTFLKEESDNENMLSVVDAMEKYIEHINSLSEEERNKIKENSGKDSDNDYVDIAKSYIQVYRNEQKKPETKTLIKDKNIKLKELLQRFSNSINSVIDEKTYEKEFNPIFSKVGINPNVTSSPSLDKDTSNVPSAAGAGLATSSTSSLDKPSSLFSNPEWEEWKSKDYFGQEKGEGKTEAPASVSGSVSNNEIPSKKEEVSKIKFGGNMETAYVDMGGGKYVPATEDQLGDPNTQLYVKNPKRGQTEYLKPTYVKVRREGNELRRQSQFGGALGSLSNLFGDIGNSLKN